MADAKIIFGRRLRLLRKARGLTLEELGRLSGIGYKHIADIERGEKVPSFEAIDKLANALHVELHEFFLPLEKQPVSRPPSLREIAREIERTGSPAVRQFATNFLMHIQAFDRNSTATGGIDAGRTL